MDLDLADWISDGDSADGPASGRYPPQLWLIGWAVAMVLVWGLVWWWHDWCLGVWRAETPAPSFWSTLDNPWWLVGTGMFCAASFIVPRLRDVPGATVAVTAFLTLSILATEDMSAAGYYRISQGRVYVHWSEAWRPDARFALSDVPVLGRGCRRVSRKHGYDAVASFVVGTGGADPESFDLGQRVGERSVAAWVDAMPSDWRGLLPPAMERDEECLDRLTRGLDWSRKARLLRLLT